MIKIEERGALAITPQTDEQLDTGQIELAADLFKRRLWVAMRRALKQRGMSQVQAAHCLAMKPSTLSRMISGPTNITAEKASAIARSAGFYLSVNLEAVEASNTELKTVEMTRTDFVSIRNHQPGNCWTFTFERSGDALGFDCENIKQVGTGHNITAIKLNTKDWKTNEIAD